MARAENSSWIVVLIAVLGVLTIPNARALSEEQLAPVSGVVAAPSAAAEPATPLPTPSKFALLSKALAESSDTPSVPANLKELAASLRSQQLELSVALVGVPDPGNGHMAMYFDQAIDALRRGASELGFSQHRFSLPSPKGKATDGAAPPKSSPEPEPRFIIFRKKRELLVAVLVLESPVLGPAPDELASVLEVVDSLRPAQGELALLGPFFSGSAARLGAALAAWHEKNPSDHARVISGTASGAGLGELITRHVAELTFQRTIPSDAEILKFLLDELRDRHQNSFRPARIALLSEFDTSFGTQFGRLVGGPRGRGNGGAERVRYFAFPSSISLLRAARSREQGDKTEKNPLSLRRTLELKLDPAEETALDVPAPTSALTTYEQELELAEEMTRICAERADYLILTASDPIDVIFLAQESRKYCPGLSLVTLGSDQLFRHPDLRATLDGMLIATGYPLLFALPPWRDAGQARPFSSQVAQSFFNAWLAIASRGAPTAPLQGYAALADAPGCKQPGQGRALWLTMIAGGSFWPISTRCLDNSEALSPPPAPAGLPPRPLRARATGLSRAAGTLVLSLAVLHALAAFLAKSRRARSFPFAPLLRRASDLHSALQARYLVGAHLSLGLLIALLSPGAWHAARFSQEPLPFQMFLFGGAALGTLCGAVLLGLGAWEGAQLLRQLRLLHANSWERGSRHVRVVALAAAATGLLITTLAALWLSNLGRLPELERQMQLTRMLDPLGMSPLAPALYLSLGFYAWSMVGLRRVRALERFSELAPLPAETPAEPRSADIEKEEPLATQRQRPISTPAPALGAVLGMLHGIWCGALWRYEAAALTLLIFPGIYFSVRVLPTWEGPAYDWLFKSTFLVLYVLVAIAFLHFLLLCWLLRRFLRQLAAHPMVDAYDRISLKVMGSFGMQFGARVPSFEELQVSGYSSDLLATLTSERLLEPALPPEYQDVLLKLHPRLKQRAALVREALTKLRDPKHDQAEIENGGHQALYLTSQELFAALQRLWHLRTQAPVSQSFASTVTTKDLLPGGSHAQVPTVALYMSAVPEPVYVWMRMAEDFVALRVATFISHVISQLRHLLTFALLAGLLLVLSVSAYPLQPARFVTVFAWAQVLVVVTAALAVIVRMERNEILSRIGGSKPGRVELNFGLLSQLFVYVVLPLVAVLANIFPEMRDLLFSWVGPIRQLMP